MQPGKHDMTPLRVLLSKFSGLFRKAHLEQQLDEDVRAHLEMLTEENLRKGMNPEEAMLFLQDRMKDTKNNEEFLISMNS